MLKCLLASPHKSSSVQFTSIQIILTQFGFVRFITIKLISVLLTSVKFVSVLFSSLQLNSLVGSTEEKLQYFDSVSVMVAKFIFIHFFRPGKMATTINCVHIFFTALIFFIFVTVFTVDKVIASTVLNTVLSWTSSAGMLLTPADFPFFRDSTAASTSLRRMGWSSYVSFWGQSSTDGSPLAL